MDSKSDHTVKGASSKTPILGTHSIEFNFDRKFAEEVERRRLRDARGQAPDVALLTLFRCMFSFSADLARRRSHDASQGSCGIEL
ncbi:hypothetical protein NL676_000773 [Syzygium grande]|nr:hypothetical protein NL676_000773 [Syzygium grande]